MVWFAVLFFAIASGMSLAVRRLTTQERGIAIASESGRAAELLINRERAKEVHFSFCFHCVVIMFSFLFSFRFIVYGALRYGMVYFL